MNIKLAMSACFAVFVSASSVLASESSPTTAPSPTVEELKSQVKEDRAKLRSARQEAIKSKQALREQRREVRKDKRALKKQLHKEMKDQAPETAPTH